MWSKNNLKFIAEPVRIVITLIILLFAVFFAQLITTGILVVFTHKKQPIKFNEAEDPNWRIPRAQKKFLPDGTIHLVFTRRGGRAGDYAQQQVYDVNDNLLWEGVRKDRPYEYLSWTQHPREVFDSRELRNMQKISPDFSRTLEVPVNSESKTEQVWRYEPGTDLFVGYSIEGGKIGYLGSTGFTESKSQAELFGEFKSLAGWVPKESFSPTLLWQTSHRIYEINFEKQIVNVLFESPKVEIKFVRMHNWNPLPRDEKSPVIEYRPTLHCQTQDGRIHLIMRNSEQKLTITVPEQLHSDFVTLSVTEEGIFLKYDGRELMPPDVSRYESPSAWTEYWREWREYYSKPRKKWVELYRIDNKGGLNLVNRFEWVTPARTGVRFQEPWERIKNRIKSCVCKVSPPVYDLAWYLFENKLLRLSRYGTGMGKEYAQLIGNWQPGNSVLNWVFSVAMMGFTFWHSWPRLTSRGKFVFWLVLVGAFNLAGLLAYWALNHTAIIKCPVCGKRRGLAQVECVRCGTRLPQPKQRKVDLIFNA